jgi:hypothetical protein
MNSQEIVKIIESLLLECWNAKDNDGICTFTWKHDECAILMKLLYLITGDEKYKDEIYFR